MSVESKEIPGPVPAAPDLGFVWLGIAYALYAANGLSAVAGARGHSGRNLSADGKPG